MPDVNRSEASMKGGVRRKVHCLAEDCKLCHNRRMFKKDFDNLHKDVQSPNYTICPLVPFTDGN